MGDDKRFRGAKDEGTFRQDVVNRDYNDGQDMDGRVEDPLDAYQDPDEVIDPDVRRRAEAELEARRVIAEEGSGGFDSPNSPRPAGGVKPAGEGDKFTSTDGKKK